MRGFRELVLGGAVLVLGLVVCGAPGPSTAPATAPATATGPATATAPADKIVYIAEDLVKSINGTGMQFPDSEKLPWVDAKTFPAVDAKFIAMGRAHAGPGLDAKHTLVPTRCAVVGDYLFICAMYEPAVRDGSFNWVVNTKTMTYVGSFFDKNSR